MKWSDFSFVYSVFLHTLDSAAVMLSFMFLVWLSHWSIHGHEYLLRLLDGMEVALLVVLIFYTIFRVVWDKVPSEVRDAIYSKIRGAFYVNKLLLV